MASTIRVLIVSHTFPPDAAVGAIRIARLCRHLPDHGIEPIVLSVDPRCYDRVDLSTALPPRLSIYRAGVLPTPLDWYRKAKKFLHGSKAHEPATISEQASGQSVLRTHMLALLETPDPYAGWYLPALRKGGQLIAQGDIDLIFSSGPPWVSHLIANRLKAKHRLPWFADFRDPWAHFLPETKGPRWHQHLLEKIEHQLIHTADLVICNTDRLRQAFINHYSEVSVEKFRTLTNGYEDVEIPVTDKPTDNRRLCLHLGSIYGLRRIDTFLEAINMLVTTGRLDPTRFRVVFQGDISPFLMVSAQKNVSHLKAKGCLEFCPRVNRDLAQALLWSADLLLLFQGKHELQVPAKFYEYLQTGIPILAVTEPGALTDLLSTTSSGVYAAPSDPHLIAEQFLVAMELPRRSPAQVEAVSGRFHCREQTRELSGWIRSFSKTSQPREPASPPAIR